ncbi:MAG: hypothetical protein GF409_01335 [Candidatus Omnitrophica bacterium]|nr:hypothetical protein [Candidatus Omnitrophota bacterium]
MFLERTRQKVLFRVVAVITLICFISFDFAWAYPQGASAETTLAQQTLLTSDDIPDSVARATAKYLEVALLKDLRKMPLAGVQQMLKRLREISQENLQDTVIRVEGSARKGQLFFCLSNGCVLRFFNPRMEGLLLPEGMEKASWEKPLNEYLSCQLLKPASSTAETSSAKTKNARFERNIETSSTDPIVERVRSALNGDRKIMVLIDGDPGTGKTSVVSQAILEMVPSSIVISLDKYIAPDRSLEVQRLYGDLIGAHHTYKVIVFEGVNLQHSLGQLKYVFSLGIGEGFIYDELGRYPISVKTRTKDETERQRFLRASSRDDDYYAERLSVRQRIDLVRGYDFIFTRKPEDGATSEDEEDPSDHLAPAVIPPYLFADVSVWTLIPVVALTLLAVVNIRLLVRIYLAKRHISEYLSEKDPSAKNQLMDKWGIRPKHGRMQISVARGVRVFACKRPNTSFDTETLYVGGRMRFWYYPVKLIFYIKSKLSRRSMIKKFALMLEREELISNINMQDFFARIEAAGINPDHLASFRESLSKACFEICRLRESGYSFIKISEEKALSVLKVGPAQKRLGEVLVNKSPDDIFDLYRTLISLIGIANKFEPEPADIEELYLFLVAIRDFSQEDSTREAARIQNENKPFWERVLDEKVCSAEIETPLPVQGKEGAQKRLLEPEIVRPGEEASAVTDRDEADQRNSVLRVFDAVMSDEILSTNPFTSTEFKQSRQGEFAMGTVVYMLEVLGNLGVLCVSKDGDKQRLYHLDERFHSMPLEKVELVRSLLYNMGDEYSETTLANARAYLNQIYWGSGRRGPDPRNYAFGAIPVFGMEAGLLSAFACGLAALYSFLNLYACFRIARARSFLRKYLMETDPVKTQLMEKTGKFNVYTRGGIHFIYAGKGIVVEGLRNASGKVITNTVIYTGWARVLYFPIIVARTLVAVLQFLFVQIPENNFQLMRIILKGRKEWKEFMALSQEDPRWARLRYNIFRDSRGLYRQVLPGIRIYGQKGIGGRVKTDVRIRDLSMAFYYFPTGLFIWLSQISSAKLRRIIDALVEKWRRISGFLEKLSVFRQKKSRAKKLRQLSAKNRLFNTRGMEFFLEATRGYAFHDKLVEKLARTCLKIDEMFEEGFNFAITDVNGQLPWKMIKIEEGLTAKEALSSGNNAALGKVAGYLHRKLSKLDLDRPDPDIMWEVYHIAIMISDLATKKDDGQFARTLRINRIFKALLSVLIVLMFPVLVYAAPNLSYTYYSVSGRIETETYVDDWDGDTPGDTSDDVPAGTVDHRIDEAFYDNGTAGDTSDDYGRLDRRTDPDGSYQIYEYYAGTDDIHFIRGYDSGGDPVFVYETISPTFAIKTFTNGAGASYRIDSGETYINSERDTDGTIRTYEYDLSWNMTEMMVYHPDGRQERHDYSQGIIEEIIPGWKFYRGANLPWMKYGYDIGDGVHGETHEGLSTKREQLLQQLDRFRGCTVRVFIYCDIRSGITFDAGGSPTGLTTHVYEDMDALVEAAQVLGIRLVPVLFDYMIADNVSMEGANPVGEYPDLITDSAKRTALVNALRPFINRYAGRPEILMWDIINEPIEITTSTTISVLQVQTFITDLIQMINSEAPGTWTTIGAQNRQILLDNWTDLGQDIDQSHYYDYMAPWYPLTDGILTWGSSLNSFGFFFGELEPTSVPAKYGDIYASGVDGGGLFWQDDTTYSITDIQADDIRHWYESVIQRPFPPKVVSVTDSNGGRTFTVTWQPYTGVLSGSVTGYTVSIGGETFFAPGAGTTSLVVDLPDHIYSGTYELSVRTEMPEPQRDSDYCSPVSIYAGRSPTESRSGGSCSVAQGKLPPSSIFGTLLPYMVLVLALLMLRQNTSRKKRKQDKEGSSDGPPELPGRIANKVGVVSTGKGNLLAGFLTITSDADLAGNTFTRREFQARRKKKDGTLFSYTTISTELEGLTALGILGCARSRKPYKYKLDRRLSRAPPAVIEMVKKTLLSLKARPSQNVLRKKKKEVRDALALTDLNLKKTYYVSASDDDAFSRFVHEVEKDLARFALELPAGYKLSFAVREIIMNSWEAVRKKAQKLSAEERSGYEGWIRLEAEARSDSLQIIVTDNGKGMDKWPSYCLSLPWGKDITTDLPWSSKESGGGSGISLVRSIMSRSGGFVSWNRGDEGGTRVFMSLPLNLIDYSVTSGADGLSAKGSILNGYKTIIKNEFLRQKTFMNRQFQAAREKEGDPSSYTTVKSELDGLVALGILNEKRPERPFEPIEYTLSERYRRPGDDLEAVLKLLDLLPPRPSEDELRWIRSKLDEQVFAEGEALTYYYLRALPQMNYRLIRLAAERATVEKELAKDPDNNQKRNQLDECLKKIRILRAEITLEGELISGPDYPLSRTRGRDYRSEARDRMRRAVILIESRNEPAASALLRAAKQRFAEELLALSKTRIKLRGPRVWRDVEDKMHNILRGQYLTRGISSDREVLIKEWVPHKSDIIWQGIRSCDREIDNILRERDWVLGVGKRLKGHISLLRRLKKDLPAVRSGEVLPQPEITDEEKSSMKELFSEIKRAYKSALVEEKVIVRTAIEAAMELLQIGEYRGMLEEMEAARSLLRKRYYSLNRQVERIGTGRLSALREYVRGRNSRIIWKLDRIREFFDSGNRQKARDWMLGMTRQKDIQDEPEFHRMLPVLWQAINNIFKDSRGNTVRRNIGIMKERVRLMVLLDSFMDGLREKYVDARMKGDRQACYDRIFTEDFNRYLEFARKNNIGRGSPRLIWVVLYLAAYVSMNMPDPDKPSKKTENPMFTAMLDLVRMLEVDSISDLAAAFQKRKNKYSRVYAILQEYERSGLSRLDTLSPLEFRRLVEALSDDAGLSEKQREEISKPASISENTVFLTDTARLHIDWRSMWKEHLDTVAAGKVYPSMTEEYRQLIACSLDPARWPALFEEDWEEDFVKEIAALTSDQLAEKFASYYNPENRSRKDLRQVTAYTGAKATISDIYVNILPGLELPNLRKSAKERVWMIREWIYRHWESVPKESSYDVAARSDRGKDLSRRISQERAVRYIEEYYDPVSRGKHSKDAETAKISGQLSAGYLKTLSEWLLDGRKKVLAVNTRDGKAAAVFSRYAPEVAVVEEKRTSYTGVNESMLDLSEVIDNGCLTVNYGSMTDMKISGYDLVYVSWSDLEPDHEKETIKRIRQKLLHELKPGAYFVMTGFEKSLDLPGFKKIEPAFDAPSGQSVQVFTRPIDVTDEGAEETVVEKEPGQDRVQQVTNIRSFKRLMHMLGMIRRKKHLPLERDVVEAWIRYLDSRGLVEKRLEEGTWIVAIKDEAADYIDSEALDEKLALSIMRVAKALRRWVFTSEGGINAVNFRASDGKWMIVGFKSGLTGDVIEHELKETELRREQPSISWVQAHNQAVEETGIGEKLDAQSEESSADSDIGSLFGMRWPKRARKAPGYLEVMDEHGKIDTQIERLSDKKKVHLKDIETSQERNVIEGVVNYLKKEVTRLRTEEIEFLDLLHKISPDLTEKKNAMESIDEKIKYLLQAGVGSYDTSYSATRTTMFSGEEAYKYLWNFLNSERTDRPDGAELDAFIESVCKMQKCLEELKVHAKTNTLNAYELALMKNISEMMNWLFGALEGGQNSGAVMLSATAFENQMKRATDMLYGYIERDDAIGCARFLDSDQVVKVRTIQRVLDKVAAEVGLNDIIFKQGNAKMLMSLWNDYVSSFKRLRDRAIRKLRLEYENEQEEYEKLTGKRDSYDAGKSKAVNRRIFINGILSNFRRMSEDEAYLKGKKGIFVCDTGGDCFVTGQDSHIEVDAGNIYITRKSFEDLLAVDPVEFSALAARFIRLYGERDLLLENSVERCNLVTGYLHNKLRALRVELGEAGEDKTRIEEVTSRMSELSKEILQLEKEENSITSQDDPAKILSWLLEKLADTREWVRNIRYMDWNDRYVEFTPNMRLLKEILRGRKRMLEIEIEIVKAVSFPSGKRSQIISSLEGELESTEKALEEEAAVVEHIHDINLGSVRHQAGKHGSAFFALPAPYITGAGVVGIVLTAVVTTMVLHEVLRQLWIRSRVRGFAERYPGLDGICQRIFTRSIVPAFMVNGICYVLGADPYRVTLKDVLDGPGGNITADEEVALIDNYYRTGEKNKTIITSKATANGAIFISSRTADLALIARTFLDSEKTALDLGSGSAKGVAVFSRYAGRAKGIEQDARLHEQAVECLKTLSANMDMTNAEVAKGNFFREDFSSHDLIYIFWPLYKRKFEERIRQKLEEKLLRELKPGAVFVMNNPLPGVCFSRLERVVDTRFDKTHITVYRRPAGIERLSEDEEDAREQGFVDIKSAVDSEDLRSTRQAVEKANERGEIKAITLNGQSIKDAEHLNSQAEEMADFRKNTMEWLKNMGLSEKDAYDAGLVLGELMYNIVNHSKEEIAEYEDDVFGVVACRARRAGSKIQIDIFAKDNGSGCDLARLMHNIKLVKSEGLTKRSGRGIFFTAMVLDGAAGERLLMRSLGKELLFTGSMDEEGVPEGKVSYRSGTGNGTYVTMQLNRLLEGKTGKEDREKADRAEPEEKAVTDIEKIKERFLKTYHQARKISWTYHGHRVRGVIEYDECFEELVIRPEEDYFGENPALEVLEKPASQMFIAPEGSFGIVKVEFRMIHGKPAMVFDEIQASRGYRLLLNSALRKRYRKWIETALRSMVNTARGLGIEQVYASGKDRIDRRYQRMNISIRDVNLWEHYEFPFSDKGWRSVVLPAGSCLGEIYQEDKEAFSLWQLDEDEYEYIAPQGPVYEQAEQVDVMERISRAVPELVNALSTAGHDRKVVIVVDREIGPEPARDQLRKMMDSLRHMGLGDDLLSEFLSNVIIRHGPAGVLSSSLESLVERGELEKENIIIITSEKNRQEYFSGFEGISTITGIDDSQLTQEYYYPLVEIMLFTVARALRYDKDELIRCYRNISNGQQLDDEAIWSVCWDEEAGSYRTTAVIRLIPGAVKLPGDRALYKQIRRYIASRA